MKILIILSIAVLGISGLFLLVFHIKTMKPLCSLFVHAALGIGVLLCLNLFSRFTGFNIPINPYTVGGAGILGVPAVCGFLILNLLL